ncbi:dynamin family protein [Shewanella sp. Isolate11]|uniref:dynamin family protein n=1 Tax=Shewanella sp. Isolate11 TaxID=2908530 RepID=UPI001EFC4D14|nr:dynamin family protein [Shewanella sp. Isolate11]MCG9697434.1 dynamin family protein [Shewanella sp. Isolate11]
MDIDSLMNGHMEPPKKEKIDSISIGASGKVNRYLEDADLGLKLCASLVAKPDLRTPSDQILEDINKLINQKFLSHTEQGENTSGASTYARLLGWFDSLKEAVSFPQLQQSHTVAVGGSFSAGKTRFLNTVLGCPSLLPVDTTPTTSIPTFLFKGVSNRIDALNFYGMKTEINEDAIKAICHAFNKKYQVTFSHILQMIAVERESFNYAHLIFLDTPGYSKSDNQQKIDENIARQHLRVADYLIWLVDSQNGTIPPQDIDFLQSLELDRPVLVLMSKADKKLESEVKDIIRVTKDDLDNAEIEYLDVIGYSAVEDSEVSEHGGRLKEFLAQVNQGSDGSTLKWQLSKIFEEYHREYLATQQTLKLTVGTLNELFFDEILTGDKKKHLTDFHKKIKAQLDILYHQKRDSEKIYAHIEGLLIEVCRLKEIALASNPSVMQLNSMGKKTDRIQQNIVTFDALLLGDLKVLSGMANLDSLQGKVVKTSPPGVSIQLDDAPEIQVLVPMGVIAKTAPAIKSKQFYISQEVQVQIISNKKASVSLSFD